MFLYACCAHMKRHNRTGYVNISRLMARDRNDPLLVQRTMCKGQTLSRCYVLCSKPLEMLLLFGDLSWVLKQWASYLHTLIETIWKFPYQHFWFSTRGQTSFKGVIRCPFYTSWYDFLGSYRKVYNILWLKFLNGSVKNTFTLAKSALFLASHYSPCCFKC